MNTFFDDTFVATSNLKTVMPGENFDLALGVDDGISVKRRIVNRFTEDTGLTNKTRRVTYEVVVAITNNKSTLERVVFKEPTPLSRDEKIVVKLLTPQEKEIGSLPSSKEVTREEDGKLVWRINLKPGENAEFSLKLSIEHPGYSRYQASTQQCSLCALGVSVTGTKFEKCQEEIARIPHSRGILKLDELETSNPKSDNLKLDRKPERLLQSNLRYLGFRLIEVSVRSPFF